LESCLHCFPTPVQEGQALRPPGSYVSERQGVQVAARDVCSTMGHQICFQKAGSGLIPLLEGADGDLLLEQRSRSRGGEATLRSWKAVACGIPLRSGSARAAPVLQ
jgi:hypothetical protein